MHLVKTQVIPYTCIILCILVKFYIAISRVERKTGVSQMVVFPQKPNLLTMKAL